MTVRIVSSIQVFNGLSTDDKPTSPPEGSTFHCIDTGEEYVYTNSMWEQDLRRIWALQNA